MPNIAQELADISVTLARSQTATLAEFPELPDVLCEASDEIARLWREVNRHSDERVRLTIAIDDILGNGSDEERWPPGAERTVALREYVARLEAEIARLRAQVDDDPRIDGWDDVWIDASDGASRCPRCRWPNPTHDPRCPFRSYGALCVEMRRVEGACSAARSERDEARAEVERLRALGEAELAGVAAWLDGASRESCPHTDEDLAESWRGGWDDQEEMECLRAEITNLNARLVERERESYEAFSRCADLSRCVSELTTFDIVRARREVAELRQFRDDATAALDRIIRAVWPEADCRPGDPDGAAAMAERRIELLRAEVVDLQVRLAASEELRRAT